MVMITSKIPTQAKLDYDKVVRGAAKRTGYDRYAMWGAVFAPCLCAR